MRRNKLNHNKQFMFAIMALAIVVLGVCIFFWMWCLPPDGLHNGQDKGYTLSLDNRLTGDSLQIMVNDSLVFDGRAGETTGAISFPAADVSQILIVTDATRNTTNSFNLPEKGCDVTLTRQNGNMELQTKTKE